MVEVREFTKIEDALILVSLCIGLASLIIPFLHRIYRVFLRKHSMNTTVCPIPSLCHEQNISKHLKLSVHTAVRLTDLLLNKRGKPGWSPGPNFAQCRLCLKRRTDTQKTHTQGLL